MRGVTCCYFSGGAGEDRLSDLNPEEIDRIEVLKGPAAATLFGAEASGGVVQVFTKRGRSNTPSTFTLNTSLGRHRLRANLPTTLRPNFGEKDKDGNLVFPAWDPNEKLIENGLINSYDLTVSGGGQDVTYFVSSGLTYEEGSIKPNDQTRGNIRVNLNWTAAEKLSVGVTSGFVRNRIWVVQAGNNWLGVYTNAMLSNPKNASEPHPYGGGIGGVGVESAKEVKTFSDTDRWTGRIQFNYNPIPSFTHQMTFGLDAVTDQKSRHLPYGKYYTYLGEVGERNLGYRRSRKFTADYLTTFDYDNLFGLSFLTGSISAGGQGYWDVASMSMATGKRFAAAGIESIQAAAQTFGDEDFEELINVGFLHAEPLRPLQRPLRHDGPAGGRKFGLWRELRIADLPEGGHRLQPTRGAPTPRVLGPQVPGRLRLGRQGPRSVRQAPVVRAHHGSGRRVWSPYRSARQQ